MNDALVWTIPNSQGDFKFYIPGNKKVLLKISGGADSAILAYTLAKYRQNYNPDIKFIFCSSVNQVLPYQYEFADKVLKWIDANVGLGDYEHHQNVNRGGKFYTVDQDALTAPIIKMYPREELVHWSGITCNPPVEEMILHKFYDHDGYADRVVERDKGHPENYPIGEIEIEPGVFKFNRPFMQHDKRGVAELYQYHGIAKELFPLTRSCEHHTTDFSSHCGKCWFCKEREWGYGVLDPDENWELKL